MKKQYFKVWIPHNNLIFASEQEARRLIADYYRMRNIIYPMTKTAQKPNKIYL